MSNKKETIQFKTEVNNLLDLMIHSLYSHKEIFFRELISNASDAMDKLRFDSVTNKKLLDNMNGDFKIKIISDFKNKTLTFSDNGIGMTHDEIIEHIGTIAKSGTKEFVEVLKKTKDDNKKEDELIGQFGVGFYSAFMVADRIELITKKAGEKDAFKWESEGKGEFSLEKTEKKYSGTEIILHMKDDCKNYLEEFEIKTVVKKYSDFISWPIVMDVEEEIKDEKDEKKSKKEIVEKTLNSQKALWSKSKSEVEEGEYNEFYKHLTRDYADPMGHIHNRIEGKLEYTMLLYIPETPPMNVNNPESKYGVDLYIKKVFIMNNCQDLVPKYLRFVKGVVDSADLPLNVSREILQNNPHLETIKGVVTKKVLSFLKNLKEKEYDKYIKFYKDFGTLLKEGVQEDFAHKEELQELMLYESTATEKGKYVSLQEYVDRMPKEQKEIYFIAGVSREKLETSPHLEAFKKKGFEVLYFTNPLDEWVLPYAPNYKEKTIKSIASGDVKLEDETKEEKEKREKKEKVVTPFLDVIKEALKDNVKDIKISNRLENSPCLLVADGDGMSSHMESLLKSMDKNRQTSKRILEVNMDHSILKNMNKLFKTTPKSKVLKDYSKLLYNQALLAEGSEVDDLEFVAKKMVELMSKAI